MIEINRNQGKSQKSGEITEIMRNPRNQEKSWLSRELTEIKRNH